LELLRDIREKEDLLLNIIESGLLRPPHQLSGNVELSTIIFARVAGRRALAQQGNRHEVRELGHPSVLAPKNHEVAYHKRKSAAVRR
jgi:hypothetical protein